ncbi:pentapeptide repeat-containing protein [Catenuloplanes atrovinosus]|uniref:Uncharacterized protein YjbI with pentapeptide repeats n=1 Tax=Catenuloplanes atrovinosus TaxID=137266 RepID=A0AAE4C7Z3_9ACTN|nr:pentapeptide repeat-containing protein [Catenuloplanes atrovinosus]MDR7274438.1 uncharacterized protein YjbI with pentapeptide repeats [Catenuloplanes atrovinosus]
MNARQSEADALCAARDLVALTALLRAPGEALDVDLRGATLPELDWSGCRFGAARFDDARFTGAARFDGAEFTRDAVFARAVFDGPATYRRALFGAEAVFGRVRFRGPAEFDGAVFGGAAWFGRGEDTLWEDDDEGWAYVERARQQPWDEPLEADPHWPVAVLIEDYQDWEEGGVGASFRGPASFRDARFRDAAWFYNARYAAGADFRGAEFGARVHLDHPATALAGASWPGADAAVAYWPLGWTVTDDGALVEDPGTSALAAADFGDVADHGLRQRVIDALCARLREPAGPDVATRRLVQAALADRLREWPGLVVNLCGAVLFDVDLTGCRAAYADVSGAQFHGTARISGALFDRIATDLGGAHGRAVFHGAHV